MFLSNADFETVRKFLYREAGIVLSDGKRQMAQGRLNKRLRAHGLDDYSQYLAFALDDPNERRELVNALTTNKTDFFREPHHFEFLSQTHLPDLARQGVRRLRVWHAGCSTGEEPYTMAMTLAECPVVGSDWDIRLLASDIDTNVLAHGEAGIYTEERVEGIPLDRRRRHFLRGTGERSGFYRVRRELREVVTFRQINLLADGWPIRPEMRFDVIFCRNVVIYFDRPTQSKLFERFSRKLKPGGLLIIGHSENLHGLSHAFQSVGPTIYRLPEPGRMAA